MTQSDNFFRSFLVLLFFFTLYGIIAINLYFIQIRQAPFFKHLGERQYNVTVQSNPQRAYILDRHDNPVAINKDSFAAFILPKTITNLPELLTFLEQHFPQARQRFDQSKQKNFMFIKRNLSDDEVTLIKNTQLADIHLLKESSRFYPYETLGAIVGITDIDNNGLFGIEQQCNKQLQGTPTTYSLKKDAKLKHFYFSKETTQLGADATTIQLTIDADLQFKFHTALKETVDKFEATEAAALALDPETGDILAMVSLPSFDPNNTKDLDINTTKNRTVTECFETGSVVKVFAALAALEEEAITPYEIIDCEQTKETKLDGIRIRTVVPHGELSFTDVIKFSNNIGIVKVTKRLNEDLYSYYKLLGFGDLSGVNLPEEQKGFVNHPSNWSAYSIQSLTYGYEITTNILQLARAFALIMNGGYLITPRLINSAPIVKKGPLISERTITDMQHILEETVQSGTGKRARISGYKIFGKTGTSNMLVNGQYDDSKHLYTFVGGVQQGDYKRVIVAYVKDSKVATYSSLVAAPLFRKLAETMLLHDGIFQEE